MAHANFCDAPLAQARFEPELSLLLKVFSSNHTVRCHDCLKFLKNVLLACWMLARTKKGCQKAAKCFKRLYWWLHQWLGDVHWSSKRRTLKLYTWRDVIAYRLSNHASTCQRRGFFICSDYSCYSKPKNALEWTTEPLFVAKVETEHVNAKMTSFWVTSRDHTPPHILSVS